MFNYPQCQFITCTACGEDHFVGPPSEDAMRGTEPRLYCEIKGGIKRLTNEEVRIRTGAMERYLTWQVSRPRYRSSRGYSMLAVVHKKERARCFECPIASLPKEILLVILVLCRSNICNRFIRLYKEEFREFLRNPARKALYEHYKDLKVQRWVRSPALPFAPPPYSVETHVARTRIAEKKACGRLWCELIEPAVDRYPGPPGLM